MAPPHPLTLCGSCFGGAGSQVYLPVQISFLLPYCPYSSLSSYPDGLLGKWQKTHSLQGKVQFPGLNSDSARDLSLVKGSLHHPGCHPPHLCLHSGPQCTLGWVPAMGLSELPSFLAGTLLLPPHSLSHPIIKVQFTILNWTKFLFSPSQPYYYTPHELKWYVCLWYSKILKLSIKISYLNIRFLIWERNWHRNETKAGMLASVNRIVERTISKKLTMEDSQ